MQRKQKKHFRKRTGIEPVIAHLKADHRLSRNFYKGIFGDNINIMLAAGFNFKRMMNKWKVSFLSYLEQVFRTITMMPNLFAIDNKIKNNSKWAFLGSTKYPFILLAMMAAVLSSCLDPQPQAPVLLEQAERLMKDRPDSAMRLVDSIFYPEKSVSQIR